MTSHRPSRPRLTGWVLAASLALQSLIGLMPMPARAHAAPMAAASTQDATARLLADLAVLCTPYGLRVVGQGDMPATPAGKVGHDICVLCGLAAGAALGVLHAEPAFQPPSAASFAATGAAQTQPIRWSKPLLPPGRGPPT